MNNTANTVGRIAKVKRTGELLVVQCKDLDKKIVHTHGPVLSFRGNVAKYDGARSYNFDAVEVYDSIIDARILAAMFHQTRKSDAVQPKILSGDLEVHLRKDGTEGRFAKAPKTSVPSATLTCPCHGVRMRMRRGPQGGNFWACPTRSETECNFTCSLENVWSKDAQAYMETLTDAAAE